MWKKMIPESAENESKKIPSNILIIGVFQEADTKAFQEVLLLKHFCFPNCTKKITADFWEELGEDDPAELEEGVPMTDDPERGKRPRRHAESWSQTVQGEG